MPAMERLAVPRTNPVRRLARRIVPLAVRRRIVGRHPTPSPPAKPAVDEARLALRPGSIGGLRKVHVGCGPHNIYPDWWNVDIRMFRGVDEVADATRPWPWTGLDRVYGEHFLEHLEPSDALAFAREAGRALRPGGVLRLSTPSLEHVWISAFRPARDRDATAVVAETYAANRAFRGWGHRFLFSREMLVRLLTAAGFTDLTFHDYGQSDRPELRDIERHGGWAVTDGWPNVWIVEAVASASDDPADPGATPTLQTTVAEEIEREFGRYVRAGH